MSQHKPRNVYCKYYISGDPHSCARGDRCMFIHDERGGSVSRQYNRSGSQDGSAYSKGYYPRRGTGRGGYMSYPVIDPKYKFIADKAKPQPKEQTAELVKSEEGNGNPSVYSTMDSISTEDIKQFEAADFQLGSIPLLPPPLKMA